jgi:hypothetical protein
MNWSLPLKPDTFKEFQEFSDEAREYAVVHGRHRTPDERFQFALRDAMAANDNMPEGAGIIMISEAFMAMLETWLLCDRDMMIAKLTHA